MVEIILIVIVMLLIFLTTFLIALNIDVKDLYKDLKAREVRRKKLKEEEIEVKSYTNKLFEGIENLIQRSNIRLYVPKYNGWIHIIISLAFMMSFNLWIGSKLDIVSPFINISVSFIFGILGFLIPFLTLQLFSEFIKEKVKKTSVDFLINFKNFLIAGETTDIFEAFEKTMTFLSEPLKSFIGIMVYERKRCKLNPIICLDNFKSKLDNPDIYLFIDNLKLCYIHGGDVLALTDEFIDEISKINDIDDHEDAEDKLLSLGLYFLLLINFGVLYFILHSKFKIEVLGNSFGAFVFVLDILISIYIVIMTIKRPERF